MSNRITEEDELNTFYSILKRLEHTHEKLKNNKETMDDDVIKVFNDIKNKENTTESDTVKTIDTFQNQISDRLANIKDKMKIRETDHGNEKIKLLCELDVLRKDVDETYQTILKYLQRIEFLEIKIGKSKNSY